MHPMKTRLVRMGNARGLRLPEPLIEQVGILDDVERLVRNTRDGWAAAAAGVAADAPKLDEDRTLSPRRRSARRRRGPS